MAKIKKIETITEIPLSPVEKVIEAFKTHRESNRKVVFDDYLVDDGILEDLSDSDDVFIETIENMELTLNSDLLVNSLPDLLDDDPLLVGQVLGIVDNEDILAYVKENINEFVDELLELDDLKQYKGGVFIKIENLDQQQKVEDFIKELYPFHNDNIMFDQC